MSLHLSQPFFFLLSGAQIWYKYVSSECLRQPITQLLMVSACDLAGAPSLAHPPARPTPQAAPLFDTQ
jgi:hypothetical protein